MMKRLVIFVLYAVLPCLSCARTGHPAVRLIPAKLDSTNTASLIRGAKLYLQHCAGCHTLKYMRYSRMAKDFGVVNAKGQRDDARIKRDWIYTGAKVTDTVGNAMPTALATQWFGVAVPDLSLIARVRGVDWLNTYLLSFYEDAKRPFGSNNALFPDVGMPNVLQAWQGTQVPVYKQVTREMNGQQKSITVLSHLKITSQGAVNSIAFHHMVHDLVNFLAYVGEPAKAQRHRIGWYVLIFLAIFTFLSFLLKKAYWVDVK